MTIHNIKVCKWFSSPHKHTVETAEAYKKALDSQGLCELDDREVEVPDIEETEILQPETFWNDVGAHKKLVSRIKYKANGKAIAIVGHQPQLTWIYHDLIKFLKIIPFWKSKVLPLRQSEVACIKLGFRKQLLWAISEYNEDCNIALKEKINSKYDLAKVFSGFITLLMGILFSSSSSSENPALQFFSSASIILSLGFSIATFFAYDRLLMPTTFWGGKAPLFPKYVPGWSVSRPPTQVHWVVYLNMVRIWNWLFVPSVVFLFIGIVLILLSKTDPLPCIAIYSIITVLAIPVFFMLYFAPKLGFDD